MEYIYTRKWITKNFEVYLLFNPLSSGNMAVFSSRQFFMKVFHYELFLHDALHIGLGK